MKRLVYRFAILAACVAPAQAAPVASMDGRIDGIGAAQFLATLQPLGDWTTPSAYHVRLYQVMTKSGGECGVSGTDDADICPRLSLFVSLNAETSQPVNFALFRLPESGLEDTQGRAGPDRSRRLCHRAVGLRNQKDKVRLWLARRVL